MSRAERFRRLTCTRDIHAQLATRSVRAGVFTAASGFADFALRFGSTAILARLIAPEHFGLVLLAGAIVAVADQLREMGLSSATVQRPELTHGQVTNLFWLNVGVGTAAALVLCAAAPFVAAAYDDPRLLPIVCTLSATLLLGGLTVQHQALLTRQLKLGHTAALRLLANLAGTLLAIGLAYYGHGYWALLWREIARAALLAAGMWLCFPWLPGLPARHTGVRPLLRFGANLTGANLLSTVASGLDRLLLGHFATPAAVGHYRQAFQLVTAPTDQLLSPLYQVAQPSLSLLQHEPPRYAHLFSRLLGLVGAVTMPLSLFVAVYATEITLLLLGPAWLEAAPVLCLLSFGTFLKQPVSCTAFIPITRGDGATYLRITLLHNATLAAALLIGVQGGLLGLALAEVATTWLLAAPRLHLCLPGSGMSAQRFLLTLARPAVASLGMGFALLALHAHTPGLLAGTIVAPLGFAALWLLLPGGRREAAALVQTLRSARRPTAAPDRPLASARA